MLKRILALLFCLMLLPSAMAEETAPIMELHQMDLGYADGYFIRCGDVEIMIDGGNPYPPQPNDDAIDCLRQLGVDTLDVYIVTHWHLDHCMNMNTILAEFGTADTVVYGASPELPLTAEGEGVEVAMSPLANGTYRHLKMDDVFEIGGMTFTCIGPDEINMKGKSNKDSVNFVIQYGTRRFLFTGDYAQSGEINNRYPELCSNVDVLKFPHHGSEPYEIGNKAARKVSPTYVLVPSGLSNYKIQQFFDNLGIKVARENVLTNMAGHVVILTDGGEYFDVRTEQNPADYAPQAN